MRTLKRSLTVVQYSFWIIGVQLNSGLSSGWSAREAHGPQGMHVSSRVSVIVGRWGTGQVSALAGGGGGGGGGGTFQNTFVTAPRHVALSHAGRIYSSLNGVLRRYSFLGSWFACSFRLHEIFCQYIFFFFFFFFFFVLLLFFIFCCFVVVVLFCLTCL